MSAEEEEYMTQEEVDTELHECVRHGELDNLREMQAQDDTNMLNFNALDDSGNSVLHKAAANGHIGMLEYLKTEGAKYVRNLAQQDPLSWAIRNQQTDVVKWLIENYSADIDVLYKPDIGLSPLSLAHDIGAVDIIEILLKHPSIAALDARDLEVSDDDEDDEVELEKPDTLPEQEEEEEEEEEEPQEQTTITTTTTTTTTPVQTEEKTTEEETKPE